MALPTDIADLGRASHPSGTTREQSLPRPDPPLRDDEADDLVVISNISESYPIGPAELDAIETCFADLLDLVLAS